MIFRTITDDLTGVNKSIGLFGKSLENVKNVLYSFQTNGIKNTLFNTPLSNIDTKAIDSYNIAIRNSVPFERALAIARRTTNAETVTLIESTNGAEVQIESLTAVQKASTIAAKAHSAALKAVSIAGNMILFTVIAKGIQLATKAIDDYIHRVERSRERTEELLSEFKQMNDTLADHRQVVADLADRYDELSKGVNLSTNNNVSLSTEEYEEFLDINEQLVQSFPELTKGIDENGNSILTLGTKGITAKEQLEELLQTKEDLNNFRIAQGLDEALEGVYTYIQEADNAAKSAGLSIEEANKQIQELQNLRDISIDLKNGQNVLFSGDSNDDVLLNRIERIKQAANEFYNNLDNTRKKQLSKQGIFDARQLFYIDEDFETGKIQFYSDLTTLNEEEINSLKGQINKNFDDINDYINEKTDELSNLTKEQKDKEIAAQNQWIDYLPQLVAGMKSQQSFKNLDEDLQDVAVKIVEGFDYHVGNELANYDGTVADFLREKVINPMTALSDEDKKVFSDNFKKLLSLDPNDLSKDNQANIEKFLGIISKLLNQDPVELRIALGFEVDEEAENRYKEALEEAKRKFGGYNHDDKGFEVNNDIGDWFDSLSEKQLELANSPAFTQALARQKEGLNGAALSAKNYQSALEDVEAQQNKMSHSSISLSSSDFLNKFETQYKPALSAIQSSINQVMEATENGIKLKVDSESAINAISDIRNAVDEINNSEEIDFNIDTRSVDEFSDKLMNALDSGDLNAVKQAYTDFANDVVNSMQDMFGDINESNMQAAQKALESVGVLNAEQIIAEKTGYSYEDYAAAKQAAANSGIDLNGSVEEVAAQLKEEGLMATEDAKALMEYVIKKAAASGKAIDVSGAIAALAKEWEWLQELIDQWGRYNSVSQKGMKGWGNTNGTEALGAGMYTPSVVGKPIEVETEVDVDLKWPNLDSSARGAGSKAGKSFKDGLKEQLSDLDSVISGVTSRIDDNIEAVRTQKEEAVAAIDAQIDALNEQKSALEDQKKALEEERDARIEIIEQQKKQLELAIKAIDKQIKQKKKVIKGIQDEIKAMQDANEQRKLQLNLQREQYELERLQHQRTILQYSEDLGMHYVTNTKDIRSQKDKVDDAKLEIEIAKKQQQIDLIEKEIDLLNEKKEAINEQIEILDEQIDQINEFYDKQIKAIDKQIEAIDKQIEELQKQKEETEKYYDSMIEGMEKSKSKYEELTELVGKAELSAKLKQLGIDEEALVNGSEEEFQKLKNAYLDVVFQLNSGNKDVLAALQELSGYNGTAPSMLEESNTKLGNMNDELGNANTEVGKVNTSLGNTASTTGKVSDNIGDLSDKTTGLGDSLQEVNSALKNIPDSSSKIGDIAKSYGELATSLQSKEGSELDTQIGNINDSLSKIPEANSKIDPIVTSYKDLKDSLTGEDGASTNDKLEDINDILDEIPNVSQSVTDIAEAYEKLSGSLTSEENVGLGKELSEINKELDVVPEPTNVTETALAYEKLDKAVVGNSDAKISGEIGNINTALGETPEPTNINNVTTAINELSVSIDKSKQSMDALSEAELNVNNNANDIAISIQSIVDNIQSAYENVETLRDGLLETNTFVVEEQIAFDILRQKIDEVVEVITEKISATYDSKSATETSISAELEYYILLKEKLLEVKESLDSINEAISSIDAMPINNLTSAFQLLYDKLLLVSNLLGVGMEGAEEGAVSGITGAIQALNEISLEEGIIAQFTMLKEAIDSVTAAISGGGGESSEGEGSGGGSGFGNGGQSGGKGGKGSQGKGESGGGNSLTGAIKEMGETAKEVIGEPDAEGDGTVIGEFGSMETAVNDVRDAIGTEGSEGGEGGNSGSGGEGDDTLVGSIEYLGDKTEEEMGEPDGDGIIGKFNEFKGVIEEAANHVKSISEGLDEIDGKEVSCTIHVNIETSGGTGFTGSAQVLGSMNLNSATYNAQYKGNAHYEGTAEVTGDWGVKEGGTTLVGELGQELVVFPNGRFKTVGDNGAEFVDIPANSIVFNHLQTKELLSKGNIVGRGRALASGTALANGTDDSIWTTLADGTKVRELQPGDRMYDMMQKFDAYFKSMDGNLEKLVPNSVYDHQRQMEDMAKQITNNSIVNNTRNVQQPITIQVGDINLTGVQDVNGLAQAIKTRLPNAMLQEMHRR